MENVRIEVYNNSFQQAVNELILDIQRNEFGVPITLEQQPDLRTIPDFYQKGNGNFWVAILNGKVVGTIALIDIGNQQIALRKMFVHKNFRGKEFNIGQALLDTALEWMSEKGCREVFLGTLDVFVAAQKFYRKNGFEEVPRNELPSNFPPMKLDNTFFKKMITARPDITILPYEKQHQPWFEKFNRDWIEKYFWMEPLDVAVLQHPEEHILEKGGTILMASFKQELAGTVALKFVEEGVYEFTKMAVDEKFRGLKIGQALAEAAIIKAKKSGAKRIILYSNRKLTPAITLYLKLGFKEIPLDGIYARGDIKMELTLNPAKTEFTIRRATLQDVSLIRELGIQTFNDTFAQSNTPEDMNLYLEKSFAPEQITAEINDKDTIFFLAYDKNEVAGYAKIRASGIPDGLTADHPLEIERIYSTKEYIGRKVGHALMEACLEHAKQRNHDVVWLGVWEYNPRAIAFYEKWGFEKFGSHPFLLGTDLQTDLLMKCQVNQPQTVKPINLTSRRLS